MKLSTRRDLFLIVLSGTWASNHPNSFSATSDKPRDIVEKGIRFYISPKQISGSVRIFQVPMHNEIFLPVSGCSARDSLNTKLNGSQT